MSGRRSSPFDTLRFYIELTLPYMGINLNNSTEIEEDAKRVLQSMRALRSGKKTMWKLLVEFHAASCADDRDKIYAFNSLSYNPLPVDYHHHPDQLFTEFATVESLLNPMAILACAGAFRSLPWALPTWVPDWRSQPVHSLRSIMDRGDPERTDFAARVAIIDYHLTIQGINVGCVSESSLAYHPGRYIKNQIGGIIENWLAFFHDLNSKNIDTPRDLHELVQILAGAENVEDYNEVETFSFLFTPDRFNYKSRTIKNTISPHDMARLEREILERMRGRRVVSLSNGYLAMGPGDLGTGDTLVAMPGSRIVIALRPVGGVGRYRVIGDCYVAKFDNEEWFAELNSNQADELQSFIII